MAKTIGIIGGTGKFGQWFKKFFEEQGHNVLIAGRKTELSPIELAKRADIVIVSVPIDKTIETIEKISSYVREDSLLMDFTSLKKEPVKAMLKSKSEVVGCHPMFGSMISSIKGQAVVLVKARSEKWFPWIKQLFENSGAKVKISTAEEHDRMMAVIQCLVHFNSITFCHALKNMGFDFEQSLDFTSPVYQLRLNTIGRILNQDAGLYADIAIQNPLSDDVLEKYLESTNELKDIIAKKQKQEFIDYFNESADYMKDFKIKAEQETNRIIKFIAGSKEM
ncbi:MAG: prephenate dehydrogenase/arogenate dehydrogenase family protein [Nanoarchaeota archaeon]|nr:prephenate dehydrogenase/arogenate dehydrogenase family protein [Nanoarchaeota archaeon]